MELHNWKSIQSENFHWCKKRDIKTLLQYPQGKQGAPSI